MPTNIESVGRRWFYLPALLAALLAAPASLTRVAQGQSPDGDFEGEHAYKRADGKEVEIKAPSSKDRSRIYFGILKDGVIGTAEDERIFSDYFRYKIAELTWKENIPTLQDKRKNFKRQDLSKAGNGAKPDLHERVNKMVLDEMQKVALDQRYPRAVRLNAVLLIGELDQTEPRGLDKGVPLADAEPALFKFLKDEKLNDAYRIDALIGLMRHADSAGGLAGGGNGELVNEMTKLLQAKELPKGKNPVGHLWLRMLACETIKILAPNGSEANQPQVVAALEAFAGEKGTELWLRCRAAEALGYIDAKSLQATAAPAAQVLAALVVEISKTHDRLMEAAGAEASKKKKKTVAPMTVQEEGEDAAPAIPENVQRVASEEVVDDLFRVRHGLVGAAINKDNSTNRGLYAASDPETQKFVQGLVDLIDKKMVKTLKDTSKTTIELLAEVSDQGAELEAQLKSQSAAKQSETGQTTDKVAEPAAGGAKPVNPPVRTSSKAPAGNAPATESVVKP